MHFLLPPVSIPQDCVEDSVTPIILRLNFSLVGKPISSLRNLQPMLAVDAQRYFTTSVSPGVGLFQRDWRGWTLDLEGKPCFAFPLSSPLRRTVAQIMSARTTSASPLGSQSECPALRPTLVPQAPSWNPGLLSLALPNVSTQGSGPRHTVPVSLPTSPLCISPPLHFQPQSQNHLLSSAPMLA